MNPQSLIEALQERRKCYHGNEYRNEAESVVLPTKEGVYAVDEAITFLRSQPSLGSLSRLISEDGLSCSARDFCIAQKGVNNHESESDAQQRLNKYGTFRGQLLQNVAICNESPSDVILGWIINDGNSRRDHRNAIFNPSMKVVGIASGPHVAGRIVSCLFAEGYTPLGTATGHQHSFSSPQPVSQPAHQPQSYSTPSIPPQLTSTVQVKTIVNLPPELQIGELKAINNNQASLLTISCLACDISGLSLQIIGNGSKLDFSRTVNSHTDQRVLNLPYQVSPQSTSAQYFPNQNGGELQITLGKIQSQSSADFEICQYTILPDPNSSKTRVDIGINSGNKDYYEFTPGAATKNLTRFTVSVKNTALQFKSSTEVREGNDIVTKEVSQSVNLPTIPARDQIEVIPNQPGGGSIVRIYHKPRGNTPQFLLPDAKINITLG